MNNSKEQTGKEGKSAGRLQNKIQAVRCLTCTHIFAVTVEEYISPEWLKNLAKYIKTGNCKVETMTIGELGNQFGYGVEKCCGRKVKQSNETAK